MKGIILIYSFHEKQIELNMLKEYSWSASVNKGKLRWTKRYSLNFSSQKVWMFKSLSFLRCWGDKLFCRGAENKQQNRILKNEENEKKPQVIYMCLFCKVPEISGKSVLSSLIYFADKKGEKIRRKWKKNPTTITLRSSVLSSRRLVNLLFLSMPRRTHEAVQQKTPFTSVSGSNLCLSPTVPAQFFSLFLHWTPLGFPWPSSPSRSFRGTGQRSYKIFEAFSLTLVYDLRR